MFISEADRDAVMEEVFDESPLSNCLVPLLQALNWRGTARQLAEVMPYYCYEFTIFSFQKIMDRLHYQSNKLKNMEMSHIDTRLLPCLFISDEGFVCVIKEIGNKCVTVYNGETQQDEQLYNINQKGTVYLYNFKKEEDIAEETIAHHIWHEHKGLIQNIFFTGFMLNLLYLSIPLFIMGVYDAFITTQSYPVLGSFAVGMGMAVIFIYLMLYVRSKVIAYVTVHIDSAVMSNIFIKLLNLPPASIETAAVSSQVAQMKNFDLIYTFLSSRLVGLLLELPFILILLFVIGFLGGYLVLIPSFMIVAYIILLLATLKKIRKFVKEMGALNSEKQDFIIESLSHFEHIRYCSAVNKWCDKFRDISAESSLASFKLNLLVGIVGIISDFIMITSGVLIIYYGVSMATTGLLSMGALIAIFILIWRTLAPLRAIASSVITFEQLQNCIAQIGRLMSLNTETSNIPKTGIFEYENAHIKVENITMRYQYNLPAVLQNINLEIKEGDILAVVGPNGSGKSTLLKLLLGLYRPLVGSIYIDEMDIRQVDPFELREAISYVPQYDTLFYGTILQNFRLVDPVASIDDIHAAAKLADVYDDVMTLTDGFDTFLDDYIISCFPYEFKRKICLARVLLKHSKILIIDEGQLDMSEAYYKNFCKIIKTLSKDRVIIFTTHNPKKLDLATKVLYLDHGKQKSFGKKDDLISTVYEKLK